MTVELLAQKALALLIFDGLLRCGDAKVKGDRATIACVAGLRAASSIRWRRGRLIGSVGRCSVVAVFSDAGISGTKGRDKLWANYTLKMFISTYTNRGSTPAPQPERRCSK